MKKGLLFSIALIMSIAISGQESGEDQLSIEGFVNRQMQNYPKSRLLDIYKSCFQDYMGAEHLVSDRQRVKAYLDEELNTTSLDNLMPWYYEPCGIDSSYYRVSIKAIKEGFITEDQLFDAFIRSANSVTRPSVESWSDRWYMIIDTIDRMKLDMPNFQEDKQFIDSVRIDRDSDCRMSKRSLYETGNNRKDKKIHKGSCLGTVSYAGKPCEVNFD